MRFVPVVWVGRKAVMRAVYKLILTSPPNLFNFYHWFLLYYIIFLVYISNMFIL